MTDREYTGHFLDRITESVKRAEQWAEENRRCTAMEPQPGDPTGENAVECGQLDCQEHREEE